MDILRRRKLTLGLLAFGLLWLTACGPGITSTCNRSCSQAVECGWMSDDDWPACREQCIADMQAAQEEREPACFRAELGISDCISRQSCDDVLSAAFNPGRYCPDEWDELQNAC